MIPVLFNIPLPFSIFGLNSIPINSFGLCLVLAFIAAWRLLVLQLRELGEDEALAEQMVTWAAIGGIVGARVLYVVSFPQNLFNDPMGTLFGGAGFVFYGGFLGGVGAVAFLLYRLGKPLGVFADIVGPAMALGYAIGRVGCQLSGDGDYGFETDLPWGMSYRLGVVNTAFGVNHHPAPVYETILSLLLCLILMSPTLRNWRSRPGQIFGVYLIGAAISRFVIEFVRIEPIIVFSLTQAQITAVVMLIIGLLLSRPKLSSKSA